MSSTKTGQNGERDESNLRVNTKENDSNCSRKHTGQEISGSVISKEKCPKLEQLLGPNQRTGRKIP